MSNQLKSVSLSIRLTKNVAFNLVHSLYNIVYKYNINDTVDNYISMFLRTQWKPIIIVGGKMKYFRRSTTSSALNLKEDLRLL